MNDLPRPLFVVGDCLQVLSGMASESVHCVITSPPYWGLRAYKGDPGMIGLEPTLDEHIENIIAVFREVRRVLRKDGTLWLNYGDAYANAQPRGSFGDQGDLSTGAHGEKVPKRNITGGLKPKDLMLMPARVALALQDDGWWLRSEIVWHKPNPMPESVTDRPTSAHEKLLLLSKAPRYYYDAEAVRVAYSDAALNDKRKRADGYRRETDYPGAPDMQSTNLGENKHGGANLRNVWQIPVHAYAGAHFATFPPALVEPCIKAGTSQKGVCGKCGAPWERLLDVEYKKGFLHGHSGGRRGEVIDREKGNPKFDRISNTKGWQPTCTCQQPAFGAPYLTKPAVVLDPFAGAGTVALVAQRLGRRSIGIEISPEYAQMARERCEKARPLTHRRNDQDPNEFKLDFAPA